MKIWKILAITITAQVIIRFVANWITDDQYYVGLAVGWLSAAIYGELWWEREKQLNKIKNGNI